MGLVGVGLHRVDDSLQHGRARAAFRLSLWNAVSLVPDGIMAIGSRFGISHPGGQQNDHISKVLSGAHGEAVRVVVRAPESSSSGAPAGPPITPSAMS